MQRPKHRYLDIMRMYSTSSCVIKASAKHLNVLKKSLYSRPFEKLTKHARQVVFFYILYIAVGRQMHHDTLFYDFHITYSALIAAWCLYNSGNRHLAQMAPIFEQQYVYTPSLTFTRGLRCTQHCFTNLGATLVIAVIITNFVRKIFLYVNWKTLF